MTSFILNSRVVKPSYSVQRHDRDCLWGYSACGGGGGEVGIRRFLDAGNVLFLDLGVGYMGMQLVKIQGAVHL